MMTTKKHLPRRTFLRGIGVSLALPLLDGMIPAFAAARSSAAKPLPRLGVVYVPNGMVMNQWTPSTEGTGFDLKSLMDPLVPFRDRIVVLTGLANKEADAVVGEGPGDHARAAAAFLTGVHPRKTEGVDLRGGVSMDQIAARQLGRETQLASLELALESGEVVGACDPGYSCAYANTLSWSSPTTPLPMENNPRVVFERLFGGSDSTDATLRLVRVREDRSILDAVTQKAAGLQKTLGSKDRAKLDQYLEAVRDVERRIQRAEEQSARRMPAFEQPSGIPDTFEDHAKMMFDLQVLAYQADLTRVITFMMGHEQSNRAFPEVGAPDAHHALSHHGGDAEKITRLAKVDVFHSKLFAYYLDKLASTPDGDQSLLDSMMIVYGSGMSDGNRHDHHNLPILIVGGGAGQIRGGRHLRYPQDTPVTNLYLTLLEKAGVPAETIGDSTGRIDHLSV
jgi:hypothetical protein